MMNVLVRDVYFTVDKLLYIPEEKLWEARVSYTFAADDSLHWGKGSSQEEAITDAVEKSYAALAIADLNETEL